MKLKKELIPAHYVGFNDPMFGGVLSPNSRLLDDILDKLSNGHDNSSLLGNSYPPHNLIDLGDNEYVIELAIAGYDPDEVVVESIENKLVVSHGNRTTTDEVTDIEEVPTPSFIHRGISRKNFRKIFTLAETVVVEGATYENGLLQIRLKSIVPEKNIPTKIEIKRTTKSKPQLLTE
jgi:molecular chaperone IbpA